ncbi:MAG: hypothetical protein II569_02150 [Paludibacteraceae bacterium]|nr:hypothetical protein [Paludibacteraceae bacterium]MBQ2590525.1 hypothetical protein [Paludibacteraceae bacterium]
MKKVLMFMTFVLVLLGVASCSDDKDNAGEYYVKYKWHYTQAVYGGGSGVITRATVTYVDADGKKVKVEKVSNGWEVTVGPVKKGFEASLLVEEASGYVIHESTIEVSRNGEPFALKARGELNASYRIDY